MSGASVEAGVSTGAGRTWTILDLLRWTAQHFAGQGIESARLDAECLLAFALGVDRLRLYIDYDKPVSEAERSLYRDLVRRRAAERVPVAQLVGTKEFWSLSLRVAPGVLAPRPDTETLVSAALEHLADPAATARILELGTGSGAVALALAQERPQAVITATDISQEALRLAQENAETLGMANRIRFLEGDWLAPLAGEVFDVIVSNPPYLGERERGLLAPELAHEPDLALFSGPEGLDALRHLAAETPAALAPGGLLAVELAPGQESAVAEACERAGLTNTALHRDLAGRPRVLTARKPY